MHEVTYDRQLKNDPFVTIAQTDLIYSLWNTLFQSCSVFFFLRTMFVVEYMRQY